MSNWQELEHKYLEVDEALGILDEALSSLVNQK